MLEALCTLCAGLFAGAACYISLVQHPAAREVGDGFSGRFFAPMYRRAAPVQAGLAAVGTLTGLASWLSGASAWWGVGALLLGFSVPFTLVVIKPLNDALVDPERDPAAAETVALLERWSSLHRARSVTSTLAFAIFLLAARAS